jgi:hypothetical protein
MTCAEHAKTSAQEQVAHVGTIDAAIPVWRTRIGNVGAHAQWRHCFEPKIVVNEPWTSMPALSGPIARFESAVR